MNRKRATSLLIFASLVLVVGATTLFFLLPKNSTLPINNIPDLPTDEKTANTSDLKLYRNEEWNFEFSYLDGWSFHENTFYSPFSKFNLIGAPVEGIYISDPIIVNIVTPDFVERQFSDLKNTSSTTNIAGVTGEKYEYLFEGTKEIDIILPFGQYTMILGAKKPYENIFNQILTTFKFLK